jgi:protein phosphatase
MASIPADGSHSSRRFGTKTGTRSFRIEIQASTDVGLVRDGNEDALLVHEFYDLYVVADGMGGHNCGEVASQFSVEAMQAFYESAEITGRVRQAHRYAVANLPKERRDVSFHALRLRKAVESANVSVFRLSQQHEALRDMGTTIVATAFSGSRVYVANVGDSRVYRLRRDQLTQLTEDHSLVNEYVKMNMLRPEDVETFPYKNVIVRAVGLHERVTVDLTFANVRAGDQILMCSDGLTDLVRDHEIEHILVDSADPEAACARLTDAAKERGGHDNITVLLLKLHEDPAAQPNPDPMLLKLPATEPDAVTAAEPEAGAAPPPPPSGPAPMGPPPAEPAPIAEPDPAEG